MTTTLDPYSLATVPLEQCANGNTFGTATGFIWKRREKNYLITNWHVVTGRNAETGEPEPCFPVRPDMLRVQFNTRVMDFGKQMREIKLRDENHCPLWYAHPVHQRRRDVVAIPLDIADDDPDVKPYPINSYSDPWNDPWSGGLLVGIGMDVFILGYPFGYKPPGFPVWKRGSIASEPDLTSIGTGYLLVDTASRPGMSGSPVIHRSWGPHLMADGSMIADNEIQTKFIGVYSGRLRTRNSEDAQLGMVWPREDIDDIIDGAKFDE
jgi:hypothetical protein